MAFNSCTKNRKNPIKRIVFHEITKDAILKALENPRDVDQNLVDAQQQEEFLIAVGYELSPFSFMEKSKIWFKRWTCSISCSLES